MDDAIVNLVQLVFVLCIIGAGFSMMLHAVLSYQILATVAILLGGVLSGITWGIIGVLTSFAVILIGVPIVIQAVFNFVQWCTWQSVRRYGYSEEPNVPPVGYATFASIYRTLMFL